MNSGLKRIEATLDQLQGHSPDTDAPGRSREQVRSTPAPEPAVPSPTAAPVTRSIQPFPLPKPPAIPSSTMAPAVVQPLAEPAPIAGAAAARGATKGPGKGKKSARAIKVGAPQSAQSAQAAPKSPHRSAQAAAPQRATAAPPQVGLDASALMGQPFAAPAHTAAPALPQSKPPSFSSHRHASHPNLAMGLLKEVETLLVEWQLELEQTVLEIQALYLEGPIVDGWLESHPSGSQQAMQPLGAAVLRHAEIDRLMDYVEEICRVPQTFEPGEFRTGYCLCGLDADGQLWSRPCPPQQVPYVGLAIARYQKLRILLARKQGLEQRLTQLVQDLTMLHGRMKEPL